MPARISASVAPWHLLEPPLGAGDNEIGAKSAVFAFDYPGFGRSGGRLTVENATVPRLAELVLRAADALQLEDTFYLAGHDIGGAVAQHITAFNQDRVPKLALVNSVLYDL